MTYDSKKMTAEQRITPSGRYALLTKNDTTVLDPMPRALWVGTAGTANLVDETSVAAADFPLKEGSNPIMITQLKTGGTADDIWGLY